MVVNITAVILGLASVFINFKAEAVVCKVLKKDPVQSLVMRVKYISLALAVIAFLTIMLFGE